MRLQLLFQAVGGERAGGFDAVPLGGVEAVAAVGDVGDTEVLADGEKIADADGEEGAEGGAEGVRKGSESMSMLFFGPCTGTTTPKSMFGLLALMWKICEGYWSFYDCAPTVNGAPAAAPTNWSLNAATAGWPRGRPRHRVLWRRLWPPRRIRGGRTADGGGTIWYSAALI